MRIPAVISAIRRETPTVKSFTLDLRGRELGFRAGQWVDFFVTLDGAEAIGGYSITSSPSVQDSVGLAIRRDESHHPVTNWLHEEARVGDAVEISLGGDFYYTPDMADSVTLVGGGIGLTPLMSVLRAADEAERPTRAALIYSASAPSELLFRRELEDMASRNPLLSLAFTVTQPGAEAWNGRVGRIDADLLRAASADLDSLFFVCGPPAMIQNMIQALISIGVPPSNIRYEQWW